MQENFWLPVFGWLSYSVDSYRLSGDHTDWWSIDDWSCNFDSWANGKFITLRRYHQRYRFYREDGGHSNKDWFYMHQAPLVYMMVFDQRWASNLGTHDLEPEALVTGLPRLSLAQELPYQILWNFILVSPRHNWYWLDFGANCSTGNTIVPLFPQFCV